MKKLSFIARMDLIQATTSLLLVGVTSMTTLSSKAATTDAPNGVSSPIATIQQVPTPKLVRTIDLSNIGSAVAIRKLSFSPNSRYLAIVVDPELGKTDIVVWDMEKGKPQAQIHCPYQYGVLADHDLLWSRDGKVISFGAKRQWDPMNGDALPDNPAIGRAARFNKDGTKMLTIVGALGQPSYIHIYDTATWAVQKLYLDGFAAVAAAWTADDKIIVGTSLTHELYSKVIGGYKPQRPEDHALLLLDPSGKQSTETKWFLAKPSGDPKDPFTFTFPSGGVGISNFKTNRIYSPKGIVIDGRTMEITYVNYFDGRRSEMAFSPDGVRLYLRAEPFKYGGHVPVRNSIVDLNSGTTLIQFGKITESGNGFAASPDGLSLALGLISTLEIFQLQ